MADEGFITPFGTEEAEKAKKTQPIRKTIEHYRKTEAKSAIKHLEKITLKRIQNAAKVDESFDAIAKTMENLNVKTVAELPTNIFADENFLEILLNPHLGDLDDPKSGKVKLFTENARHTLRNAILVDGQPVNLAMNSVRNKFANWWPIPSVQKVIKYPPNTGTVIAKSLARIKTELGLEALQLQTLARLQGMRFGDFVELKQSDIDYYTGKTTSKVKAKGRAKRGSGSGQTRQREYRERPWAVESEAIVKGKLNQAADLTQSTSSKYLFFPEITDLKQREAKFNQLRAAVTQIFQEESQLRNYTIDVEETKTGRVTPQPYSSAINRKYNTTRLFSVGTSDVSTATPLTTAEVNYAQGRTPNQELVEKVYDIKDKSILVKYTKGFTEAENMFLASAGFRNFKHYAEVMGIPLSSNKLSDAIINPRVLLNDATVGEFAHVQEKGVLTINADGNEVRIPLNEYDAIQDADGVSNAAKYDTDTKTPITVDGTKTDSTWVENSTDESGGLKSSAGIDETAESLKRLKETRKKYSHLFPTMSAGEIDNILKVTGAVQNPKILDLILDNIEQLGIIEKEDGIYKGTISQEVFSNSAKEVAEEINLAQGKAGFSSKKLSDFADNLQPKTTGVNIIAERLKANGLDPKIADSIEGKTLAEKYDNLEKILSGEKSAPKISPFDEPIPKETGFKMSGEADFVSGIQQQIGTPLQTAVTATTTGGVTKLPGNDNTMELDEVVNKTEVPADVIEDPTQLNLPLESGSELPDEPKKGFLSKAYEGVSKTIDKIPDPVKKWIPYIGGTIGAAAVIGKAAKDQAAHAARGEEWPQSRRLMFAAQTFEEVVSPFPVTTNDLSELSDWMGKNKVDYLLQTTLPQSKQKSISSGFPAGREIEKIKQGFASEIEMQDAMADVGQEEGILTEEYEGYVPSRI